MAASSRRGGSKDTHVRVVLLDENDVAVVDSDLVVSPEDSNVTYDSDSGSLGLLMTKRAKHPKPAVKPQTSAKAGAKASQAATGSKASAKAKAPKATSGLKAGAKAASKVDADPESGDKAE